MNFPILTSLLKPNNLYANSIYLITATGISYVTGFLFWIIVSRIYPAESVGTATALFSLAGLVSSISILGFNTGLLKHLPEEEGRNEKINSSLIIVSVFSGMIALGLVALMPYFFKSLVFVRENIWMAVLFIFFNVTAALNLLSDSILIAFRSSFYVLIKSVIQGVVKLSLPFLFLSLGGFGIFIILSLGVSVSLLFTVIILLISYGVIYRFRLHFLSVKKMAYISFGSYVSGLITTIPAFVLPLFINSSLGPQSTAFYFIAATTANALFIIPQVITQNLLVEGSYYKNQVEILSRKTARLLWIILIPATLLMLFFGEFILQVFGKEYSTEGLLLLKLMAISGIFVGANYIFGILLTIFHRIKTIIFINLFTTLTLLVLSYQFLSYGISGIGYATVLTQIIMFILYTLAIRRLEKINSLAWLF